MRTRVMKLLLLVSAAVGGVVWWQRRNETPPTPPDGVAPTKLRPAEPFMDPAMDPDPVAGDQQTAAAPSLPSPPREPFTAAPPGPVDDLKRITGIGPKMETLLNEQGITTFAQLAALGEDDIDQLQERMPQFPGRIRRDGWVEQAARLSGS